MFSSLFKKEVGPYVLGKLIGTGATSTVHLGEHKDTKKMVLLLFTFLQCCISTFLC
jgi:hypothetical protein